MFGVTRRRRRLLPSVTAPTAYSILTLTGAGALCAKEHSWGQPALAEPLTAKEGKQGPAGFSWDSKTIWCALKRPPSVVRSENGRAGGLRPE